MKKISVCLALIWIVFSFISVQASDNNIEKEFWPNGKIRLEQTMDSMGDVLKKDYYYESGTPELTVKYDNLGNKILEVNYDLNGKYKENADGWAILRWKYIGDNMVAEGYYGADGAIKEIKQYDSSGNLVNKKYYGDRDIDPDEEYNPGPTLAGESNEYYDEYGRPEGKTSVETYNGIFPDFWNMDDMINDRYSRARD